MKQLFLALVFVVYAAVCFGQQGPNGRVTPSDLEQWRQGFQPNPSDATAPSPRPDPATVDSLNRLDGWLKSTDDIRTFRTWNRDDDVVQSLIPLAAGSFSETRLPATFILGNVVDNTNVCRVLDYLSKNPDIEPNGRYNLLQVVLQVSEYAFDDTAIWIGKVASDLQQQLSDRPNNERTLALLARIKTQLQNRSLGKADRLETLSPTRFGDCVALLGKPQEPSDTTAVFPSSLDQLTDDSIRDLFFSADRRKFAEHLVKLYEDPSKKPLVHSLTEAIIAPGDDPEQRYRVNLYIALTFSLLPEGSIDNSNDGAALKQLARTAEMKDATFADNVKRALAKQGIN